MRQAQETAQSPEIPANRDWGQNEAQRRYAHLADHHPHHYYGQAGLLQQLCPKWGGSWEAAYRFARECSHAGGLGGVVLAEAYLEQWLDSGAGGKDFLLRRPNLVEEITDAARRSVFAPTFRSRYLWLIAHNVFAALFSVIGDYPRAAVHFRALGGAGFDRPWAYFGNQAEAFTLHQTRALAQG